MENALEEYYKDIQEWAKEQGIHPRFTDDVQKVADAWGISVQEVEEFRLNSKLNANNNS